MTEKKVTGEATAQLALGDAPLRLLRESENVTPGRPARIFNERLLNQSLIFGGSMAS